MPDLGLLDPSANVHTIYFYFTWSAYTLTKHIAKSEVDAFHYLIRMRGKERLRAKGQHKKMRNKRKFNCLPVAPFLNICDTNYCYFGTIANVKMRLADVMRRLIEMVGLWILLYYHGGYGCEGAIKGQENTVRPMNNFPV